MVRGTLIVIMLGIFLCGIVDSSSINITWADCGTAANKIKVNTLVWYPVNPKTGDNITIVATGVSLLASTAGQTTESLADGLISKTFDTCQGATIDAMGFAKIYFPGACPMPAGPFNATRYVYLSSYVPTGVFDSSTTSVDSTGAAMLCMAMKFLLY
eukprot:TRINITY_DN2480_c0_g1_i1.p2 TRINITY_DN2480_c0_g1~~TRINITY_DN2480_c0_g1_i1.p2  ORF type:complete len:169 (-),score=25.03 TRINITY_DN2480_c0_g1_i1:230-700(-)